jgi:hypothetical protein
MDVTTQGVAAPQLQGIELLQATIAKAKEQVAGEFFDISKMITKVASTGRTGMQVTCESGKTIQWWETYENGCTMFDCITHVEGNRFRVTIGADIDEKTGNIIPKGSKGGGFWK